MAAPSTAYLLPDAEVNWDEEGRPRSVRYDDYYYGAGNRIDEKRHVFLELNHLERRWQSLPAASNGHFTLVELGFGFGLNFLLTCDLWRAAAPSTWHLHYLSIEHRPPSPADLERATADLPGALQARRLLQLQPQGVSGFHRRRFAANVSLTLLYDEAASALEQLSAPVDAWYLDGFRPDRNRDMWNEAVCDRMAALSREGATFSTYSAAGWVRRGLERAGFTVTKRPGFGRKKELMTGHAPGRWTPQRSRTPGSVAVIGAGLTGTTCAEILSRRGIQVTLLEREEEIVRGASGMHQLAYYPQLSARPTWQSLLSLTANLYLAHYLAELHESHPFTWQASGLLKLLIHPREEPQFASLREAFSAPNGIARWVDAGDTASVTGLELAQSGLMHLTGGWVAPNELGRAQLARGDILLQRASGVAAIEEQGDEHVVLSGDGRVMWRGDAVVVASGIEARQLPPLDPLPLEPVRGQTSHLPATGPLIAIRTVISGDATLFPAHRGVCNVAATYDPDDAGLDWRSADERKLADDLAAMLRSSSLPDPEGGSVGVRCVARDRTPVVGILPDWPRLSRHYARLRRNAHAHVEPLPDPWTGRFVATAFGSHGLNQIPLACEHLLALLCGEPSPLPADVSALLDPARFLLRDLRKQRV